MDVGQPRDSSSEQPEATEPPLALRLLWPEMAPEPVDSLDQESAALAERRAKVFRLYARGLSIRAIAEHESVKASKSTVGRDVQHVMDSYRLIAMQDAAAHVARELSRLAILEAEALDAWDRSKGEQREEASASRGEFQSSSTKRRTRDGNPSFLKIAVVCWDRRCRLLGLLKSDDFRADAGLPPVKLVAGMDPTELV